MHLCLSDFHMLSFTFPAAPMLVKGNWVGRLDDLLWLLEVAKDDIQASANAFATTRGLGDILGSSTVRGGGKTNLGGGSTCAPKGGGNTAFVGGHIPWRMCACLGGGATYIGGGRTTLGAGQRVLTGGATYFGGGCTTRGGSTCRGDRERCTTRGGSTYLGPQLVSFARPVISGGVTGGAGKAAELLGPQLGWMLGPQLG
jgi:hypothetical protein